MVPRVLLLVLVGASAAGAADAPPSAVEAQVRVALALSRCRCDVKGEKCADGPDATKAKVSRALAQSKADADRYEQLKSSVSAKKVPVTFAVGKDAPAGSPAFPAGFKGYAAGVYQLTPEAGYVGVHAVVPAVPSPPPLVGPVCPDGLCPIRQ